MKEEFETRTLNPGMRSIELERLNKDNELVIEKRAYVCPITNDTLNEEYCRSFSKGDGCKNFKRGKCWLIK